jgi:hypothetical protein
MAHLTSGHFVWSQAAFAVGPDEPANGLNS